MGRRDSQAGAAALPCPILMREDRASREEPLKKSPDDHRVGDVGDLHLVETEHVDMGDHFIRHRQADLARHRVGGHIRTARHNDHHGLPPRYAPDGRRIMIASQPSEFGKIGLDLPRETIDNSYDTQLFVWNPATDEAEAIMQWLADDVSPYTYVNVMGQYQPQYQVGEIARDGKPRYESINRRPTDREIAAAHRAAHAAGLSRLDARAYRSDGPALGC